MKNEILKSLVITNKNEVKEISYDKYTAPCIVEGGAIFKNGIKLGFCKDIEPCDGSISSNNNKLLFFTSSKWHNIPINGLEEFKYIDVNDKNIILNFNYHNLYYITIKEYSNIDLTFNLNDNINKALLQNIVIIIDNQSNNNNIKLNIKSNIKIIQNNNEIKEIKVFSNNIKLLKIKTFLDFILLE